MVTLFIFYLHVIAAVWAFTKRWQHEGLREGLLAVVFIALIFSVGWSMSTVFVRMMMDQKGFGIWFDRDAASLTLLALLEGIFFYIQTQRKKRSKSTV